MKLYILIVVMMTAQNALGWEFSGQTGPYLNALGIPSTTVTQGQKSGLLLDLSLDKKMGSGWKFNSDLYFRTDFIARDSQEYFQFIPKNFHLQKKSGDWTWKFGYQTMQIDGPDIVNPADILHAKNWIDPTAPVPMSSPGISLSQEIDEWNWEIMYVPRQTAAVLPGEHSPWLPRENRLPIESENTEMRIPDNVQYQYLDPIELNNARDNNVSLKIQRKSEDLELQLLYYNGLSQSPFLLTQIQGTLISVNPQIIQVDSPAKLQPLYYRHQAFAGTFMIPFESWAIRGGFNWLRPEGSDSRIPKDTQMGVIGVEKSVETSFGLVTGIAEYIKSMRQDANQISFLRSVFEEAVGGGLRIPYGEETTFYLGGVYDLVGESSLYKFSAQRRISNSWSIEAQGQFLQGPDETLIGIYNKYDSYQIKLMFSW